MKEAFAEGILRLARDTELRQQIGSQAQRLAQEKYGPDTYMTKLEQVYRMLESSTQRLQPPISSER